MRLQHIALLFLASGASASWFGGPSTDPNAYTSWSTSELNSWLKTHNIDVPNKKQSHDELVALVKENWNSASVWTQDQYLNTQKSFSNLRESSFDAWDESQLRTWLLEQGIVAPKGKKEELQLLAKQHYNEYLSAAAKWGNWASDTVSSASDTASSTISSVIATATDEVASKMDDAKDYVWSTWDDNRLRTTLEERGVIKTKSEKKREELLALARESYLKVANPVYSVWSTSYIHSWLVAHNLVAPTPTATEKARASLVEKMNRYYYNTNSYVYDTWTDSELRGWLIGNGVIKPDAKVSRDKLLKYMKESYASASSNFFSAWTDSQLRDWLVSNGYIRSDAQVKRDEMMLLIQQKYKSSTAFVAPYLAWPDNRLRAFLAEHGVLEKNIPETREGLLQKTRSLFTTPKVEEPQTLLAKVTKIVNSNVEVAEEKLLQVWELLSGYSKEKYDDVSEAYDSEKKEFEGKAKKGKKEFDEKAAEGKKNFWGKYDNTKEAVKSEL